MYRHPDFKTLLVCAALSLCAKAALATAHPTSAICERAAVEAATESGVPLSVLRAISLTETGHKRSGSFQPWPWTVNMKGVGRWFDTYDAAKAYVDRHFKQGARSFDVGCFQINYRWHHQAFTSIEQMFEPRANALYAARFLSELYAEFGSWPEAAGAYHSRTPKYARKYTARFSRIQARLETLPKVELVDAAPKNPRQLPSTRVNHFPLLQRGTQGRLASLVPLNQAKGARFIDVTRPIIKPVN